MRWTGIRPSQRARLQPDDFRLDEPTPFVVVPRGKGGRLAAIPLVGEGLQAARDFKAARAYGTLVVPERQQGAGARRPEGRKAGVHRVSDSAFVRDGALADGIGGGGHPGSVRAHGPGTTMIYALPQLQKHAAAIACLERADRPPAPLSPAIRLAETAGSVRETSVSY